jgi:hypothetical protein
MGALRPSAPGDSRRGRGRRGRHRPRLEVGHDRIRPDPPRGRRERGQPACDPHPPQDGTSLDAEEVFGVAAAMAERWPRCTFVLDPEAGGEQLAQRIDREMEAMVMTTRRSRGRCARRPNCSLRRLQKDVFVQPDDEELNRHVLSAAAKFYGVGWRFVKPKGKALPIDGAVALAMAVRVLTPSSWRRQSRVRGLKPQRAL